MKDIWTKHQTKISDTIVQVATKWYHAIWSTIATNHNSTSSSMREELPPTWTEGLKKVVKSWGGGAWDVGVGGCWGGTIAIYCPPAGATPVPPLPPLTYPRLKLMPYKEPEITASPSALWDTGSLSFWNFNFFLNIKLVLTLTELRHMLHSWQNIIHILKNYIFWFTNS